MREERLTELNHCGIQSGEYVLYWMQQSQRPDWNHALEHAIHHGNKLNLPIVTAFGISQRFPEANERHYLFMLEGLQQTMERLRKRNIRLVLRLSPPAELIPNLASEAALVVTDRGYLRVQKQWRRRVSERVPCRMVEVETDAVVPVGRASSKEEYAARTLRPKIGELLSDYLNPMEHTEPARSSLGLDLNGLELTDLSEMLRSMRISRDASPVTSFQGGPEPAHERLQEFISTKLNGYSEKSSDPNADCVSRLSPYLHFGQISPLEMVLSVQNASSASEEDHDAFLEQLIIRRELAFNFCEHNDRYDEYECLPEWALETLSDHADDEREYTYTMQEFDRAQTHDPYWNAAQKRLVATGYMHNYMRMYWGKKILEWTPDPRTAYRSALTLNNRYELDGRDPCSFANIAWCFGKHDQGWKERAVYGKVRYMNANGLERKFDMNRYLKETEDLLADTGYHKQ